ncbi:MAG: DUF87 domain-containing protein [Clostridia bacterium]|nr:DUF87 domain-containing protein [Clostridia bacterium]
MNRQDKYILESKTRLKYQFLRLKTGIYEVTHKKLYSIIAVTYILVALLIWVISRVNANTETADIFSLFNIVVFQLLYPLYAVAGFIVMLIMIGTPKGAKSINENLWRIGLTNHAAESPLLLRKYRQDNEFDITIMEFEPNGIPLSEWQDKQERIETALNVHIIKFEQGTSKRRILLYTVSGDEGLPKTVYWKEKYLSDEDFTLIFGYSMTGQVNINLAKIPHILLGGSTGSGKSVLLKLLIMQCIKKEADVFIADFKGGVDFLPEWHEMSYIITEENTLLEVLTELVNELENRKQVLRKYGCANIGEYNKVYANKMKRIVFACDEVAEVLDKTGLSKDAKELVTQIEGKLSIIARQGRAFGIHLILATQRPDANILTGQIRNNIDFRVCGRADNVLSQIILDNTEAADKIPKESQGLFITHDGVVFQGYLFDEKAVFVE